MSMMGVCKVFVTVDVNSSEKPVIYCRAGLCSRPLPPILRHGGAQRPAPTMVGEKLVTKILHTPHQKKI